MPRLLATESRTATSGPAPSSRRGVVRARPPWACACAEAAVPRRLGVAGAWPAAARPRGCSRALCGISAWRPRGKVPLQGSPENRKRVGGKCPIGEKAYVEGTCVLCVAAGERAAGLEAESSGPSLSECLTLREAHAGRNPDCSSCQMTGSLGMLRDRRVCPRLLGFMRFNPCIEHLLLAGLAWPASPALNSHHCPRRKGCGSRGGLVFTREGIQA